MLNTIFTIETSIVEAINTPDEEGNTPILSAIAKLGAVYVGNVPECREYLSKIVIQANVPSIEVLEIIKGTLTSLGGTPEIIGVWNHGLQLGYEKVLTGYVDKEITYEQLVTEATETEEAVYETITETIQEPVYNIQKEQVDGVDIDIVYPFNKSLYIDYLSDVKTYDEGVELTSARPIIATQVNKFAGSEARDLITY